MPSRRERYRQETAQEIRERALRQMEEGGAASISLNRIAREMGMTGPALYRYYASRDALLTDLIVAAYENLADAIERAATSAADPQEAFVAGLRAYRDWAHGRPATYYLIMGEPIPGYRDEPHRTTPAARRALALFIQALIAVSDRSWEEALPDAVLGWTRLHGFVSLEIAGHFATMPIKPDRLFDRVVEELLTATATG